MFVRKKKNKSGVISIQVIVKSSGKYKLIKLLAAHQIPKKLSIRSGRGSNGSGSIKGSLGLIFKTRSNYSPGFFQVLNRLQLQEPVCYWKNI